MIKYFDLVKRSFIFYKDHYLFLSSAILFIFTTLCYLHTDRYFSHFDIDFLIFGGFTDVYQVALSNGVLGTILFISVMTCMMTVSFIFIKDAMELKSVAFIKLILLATATSTVYLAADMIFISGPLHDAEHVKSGFSTRFNLNVGSTEIRCQAIIGSTKEYLITWDHEKAGIRAISRSTINQFEMIIEPPPGKYPLPPGENEEDKKAYGIHLADQAKWSSLLTKKCNQNVVWPQLRFLNPQAN
jgi:hypothetical protein